MNSYDSQLKASALIQELHRHPTHPSACSSRCRSGGSKRPPVLDRVACSSLLPEVLLRAARGCRLGPEREVNPNVVPIC